MRNTVVTELMISVEFNLRKQVIFKILARQNKPKTNSIDEELKTLMKIQNHNRIKENSNVLVTKIKMY